MGKLGKAVKIVKAVGREIANSDMKGGGDNHCQGCGRPISGKKTVCNTECATFYSHTKFGKGNY